ncbi:MAG: radical SAM/SPASM domain-containing protein [Elusimicrobiales bacterium]
MNYGIDSHKLAFHPERVAAWRAGKDIFPIYAEISPSGACNHRCVYCALDFMEYKPRMIDADILKKRLSEMGRLGLKSAMFAGEGEPFLHPRMAEITEHCVKSGVDAAFTTNAVPLRRDITERILPVTSWIKASVNGGTAKTYAAIHRTKPEDFEKAFSNMAYAAELKRRRGYRCALGMQMILLPENEGEAVLLAKKAKAAGMNYLVIKPYSQHPQSRTRRYADVKYSGGQKLAAALEKIASAEFSVIFRSRAMEKWDAAEKPYCRCLALPFWTYIDSGGNVWGCSMFLGKKEFYYGNINESSFSKIWKGAERKKSLAYAAGKLDARHCRVNCRMDEINRYLWNLKTPPEHVNFI